MGLLLLTGAVLTIYSNFVYPLFLQPVVSGDILEIYVSLGVFICVHVHTQIIDNNPDIRARISSYPQAVAEGEKTRTAADVLLAVQRCSDDTGA